MLNNLNNQFLQNYQFTELDIMTLWNSFRIDFPEGKISEPQLMDVVKRVFPKYKSIYILYQFLHLTFSRCDADVVINNIFKAFDSEQTGKVVAQELLMCFSMSMKGSGLLR